jgi:hypothetical protein
MPTRVLGEQVQYSNLTSKMGRILNAKRRMECSHQIYPTNAAMHLNHLF